MSKIPMLERFAAQSLVEHEGELIFSKEKFAELIIDECANWINENVGMINEDARADLHKHFGVEKCHFTLTQTNVGIAEFKNERTNSRTS